METARLADVIEGVAGEFSPFEELHGFSIDGVDLTTSVLPDGWRERLVRVSNANTAAPSGEPRFIGWCLDKEDICVAKLCALREKDRNHAAAAEAAQRWLASCRKPIPGDEPHQVLSRADKP